MKKNVIFLICLMFSLVAIGQNEKKALTGDIDEVQVSPPKFTGIKNATTGLNPDNSVLMKNYLKKNVLYPKDAVKCNIEGTEIVQFTVTPSGNVTDFKVVNSVCSEIDNEVISTLRLTAGMWIPGVNNGEPTSMEKEVSIRFACCPEYAVARYFTQKATMYYNAGIKNLMVKNKPKKALRFFNMGIRYLPNESALLAARGLCSWELGDVASAENDWKRATALDETIPHESDYDLSSLKGYAQMVKILEKNEK